MPLTPQDATQALRAWPTLGPSERERLRPELKAFHDAGGADQLRQIQTDRLAPLANLEKHYLDGPEAYRTSLPHAQQQQRARLDDLIGHDPDYDDRAANLALASQLLGKPVDPLAYEAVLPTAYARLTGTMGPGDHASFTDAAKQHFTELRKRRGLLHTAGDQAARAALTSDTWAPAYADWQKNHRDHPDFDLHREAEYRQAFAGAFQAVSQEIDYARPAIRRTLSTLREKYGVTEGEAPELSLPEIANDIYTYTGDDPRTRQLVLAAVAAEAEAQGIIQARGVGANLGENAARGTGDVIGGAGRYFARQYARGGAVAAGAAGAEGLQEALEGTATTIEIATDLRHIADQSIDPIQPLLTGWRGTVERGLYSFARSVPYTATVMLGPGGMATTTLGLAEGNAAHLRAQGASTNTADTLGLVAAVPEMMLERLQGKLATGATFDLLQKTARTVGLRGATGIGGRVAAEFITEKTQDLVLPTTQQLARAVAEDIPDVDWDSTFQQWTDLEANAELLVAVFPLSLLGAGGATYREFKSGAKILQDRDALRLIGLNEDTVEAIATEPDPVEATRILQQAYPDRDIEATAARGEQYSAAAKQSRAAIRQLEQRAAIPRITRTPDGEAFLVTDPETGATYNALTAGDAADIRRHVLEERTADAPLDAELTELTSYFLDRNQDVTIETSPNQKSLQDAVDQGARDAQGAYERIKLEEQATGIDFGDATDLSAVRVLGENIGEYRDNLYTSTLRLYQGADLLTVVEEKAEADARKWNTTGTVSYTQLRDLIRTHDADLLKADTDEAIIEAWSGLVKAAAIERSRDDFQPSKGFRGALARLIRGYREYFRQVMRQARNLRRARQAGTLDADLDILLQQSLNIGEDATYAADTTAAAGQLTGNTAPATPTYSIGRAQVQPDAETTNYPTADGGLIGPATFNIRAHHGTPHKVDKFSTDNIGTGEGAQAYGWGLYFAQAKDVAESYRISLAYDPDKQRINGKQINAEYSSFNTATATDSDYQIMEGLERLMQHATPAEVIEYGKEAAWDKTAIDYFRTADYETFGGLYTVNLKADQDELLDWDKPLSEQSAKIKKILGVKDRDIAGEERLIERAQQENKTLQEFQEYQDLVRTMDESRYFRDSTGGDYYADTSKELIEDPQSLVDIFNAAHLEGITNDYQRASAHLSHLGIKGIRYLDGDSRDNGEGTHNYVIFDAADVEILEENGNAVSPVKSEPAPTYSIQPRTIQRRLEKALTPALATPEARKEAYENARRRLGDEAARWAKAATGRRTKKLIASEAKHIEEQAYQEFLDANPTILAHLEAPSVLSDVMQHPVTGYLLGEVGKLESRSSAVRRDSNSLDQWDDAPYLPSYFYGGRTRPDDAAQQLYNAGLLNTPDVGEMWLKLDGEFSTTQRYKQKYREAKDIDRRARRDAKERAKAWQEAQLRDQNRLDRRSLARSLATLDTILAAFPPEVRARVGGYSTLASFDSDEARLKYIESRIAALDRQLERYLQSETLADIAILLQKARAKVKTEDRIKRSRLGPEADRQLDKILAAIALDPDQADQQTAALETAIATAETDDTLAEAVEAYTIHNLFSNLRDRSAAELDAAHHHLKEIVENGRAITRALEEENRQRRQDYRDQVATQVVNPTDDTGQRQRDTRQEAEDERFGKLGQFIKDHLSFGQVLDDIFTSKQGRAPVAEEFTARVRRATHAKTDAILARRKRFRDALARIFGTGSTIRQNRALHRLQKRQETTIVFYEGRTSKLETIQEDAADRIILGTLSDKRFKKNSQEFLALEAELKKNRALAHPFKRTNLEVRRVTDPGKPVRQRLSQLEAVYYLMMAQQGDYAEILHAHGIDQTALSEMEGWLTHEARMIRHYLQTEYKEGYDHLNPTYRSLYGTDMPKVDNYAPAHFEHAGADREIDMLNTGIAAGGMGAGFVKSRRSHNAEPVKTDALAAYWSHAIQVEQFVHMTPVVNDLRATFLHPATKQAVKAAAGKATAARIGRWIDTLASDGRHQAQLATAVSRYVSRITTTLAHVGLGYKIGTLMKQASASLGAVLEMPVSDLARALPGIFRGEGSLRSIFRSSTVRRRIESGYSPEVRAAINAGDFKPSLIFDIIERGLLPIAWVDAAFTTFGASLAYNHHLKAALARGMTDADARTFAADRMDAVIARTAQPAETPDRSLAEIDAVGASKLVFMFRSEPRQKFAIAAQAATLMLKGRMTKTEAGRRIFTAWILMPMVTETMGNLYLDAFTDLEDEEIWSAEDYAIAAALGPVSGIFIAGSFIGALAAAYTDKRIYSEGNPLIEATKALADLWRWNKKDEGFLPWQQDTARDQERATILYLKALAQVLGGRSAILGQATSVYRQITGLISNITTPDDPDDKPARSR